jgi:hypothetical protein
MSKFIKVKVGQETLLVEVTRENQRYDGDVYRSGGEENSTVEKLDQMLDRVIQKQIVEHCKILMVAFEQLKTQPIPPKKASAEFGLQFNAEGNVYVAKVGSQSTFRISFEWEL